MSVTSGKEEMENYIKENLPYEKFQKYGGENLTDAELLAIILRTGTKHENALTLAGKILDKCRGDLGILGLYHISMKELMEIRGIGEVKAVKIKCVAELSKRISMTKAKEKMCFNNSVSVADYYMEQMRHLEKECTIVLYLDIKGQLLEEEYLTVGSMNESLLPIRNVLKKGLMLNALCVLLLHNHPSGDPTPSRDDILITKRLRQAAELMELELLDHIIIGDKRYTSFKEQGIL